ncbi:MAG: hypothetical protein WA210_11785 [Burkholderiaceae bacterium]
MKALHQLVTCCAVASAALNAAANDFPTVERVLYVQECMKANPGPHYEMVNKCSCAVDALAREVKFDDYSNMLTIVNAMTISGERGNALRDNDSLKPQIKRFRELQSQAQKACFIAPR